jgi:fatty acid synthase
MKWDHSDTYVVNKYPEHYFRPTASNMNVNLILTHLDNRYLIDHCIDGKVIFPATGYLMLAWRIMAGSHGKPWNKVPVVFEDVQIRRPIFLSESETTKITVTYLQSTGNSK